MLLLDEPLGALDLKLRHRLQIELTQIHREVGTTFVYVTHDQEEAMSMADRIAVISDGRLEQLGTPHEIYQRPASRFVADFIGDSNFFDVTVDGDVACLRDGTRVPCAGGRPAGPGDADGAARGAHLADAAAPAPGSMRGRSLHASFLGSYVRVAVDCAGARRAARDARSRARTRPTRRRSAIEVGRLVDGRRRARCSSPQRRTRA